MKKTSLFKYILALLLFGSNGIIAGQINLNSYEIVMFRTMLGSMFLLAIYIIKHKKFTFYKHKKSFAFLLGSGITMGISWLFLYEAYQQIGVSIASLGYYCGPVFVMLVSPLLFQETFSKQKICGFLTVFVGIILVNCNAFQENHTTFGIICALLSAVMYAFMVILNKKVKHIKGLENASLQLFIAFLTVLIFLICKSSLSFHVESSDIIPLFILGIINTGTGCYLYFSSIGNIQVQTVAILGYFEPLSAIIFSVIFLRESLSLPQIIGAVFIIAGAVFAQLSKRTLKSN